MAIPFTKIKNRFGLDDVMPFGIYQGYTVLEIIKDRPTYISWLTQNTAIKFYESVHDELSRHLKHHVPAGTGVVRSSIRSLEQDMWNQGWDDDIPF